MRGHRRSPWVALALAAALLAVRGEALADDAPPPPASASAAPVAEPKQAPLAKAVPIAEPEPSGAAEPGDPAPDGSKPDARASSGAKAGHEAAHTLRRVRKGVRIEIRARDLRLDSEAMDRLERIAGRYYDRTHTRLIITGGMRHPQIQAKLMYDKLAHGEDLLKLYENTAAAREIRNTYRDGVAHRVPRSVQVRRIRDTIQGQLSRGVYVSKHLSAVAADVRSRGMNPAQEKALRAAVAAEPGVEIVDERGSAEPHFHLDLLATPPGPPPTEK